MRNIIYVFFLLLLSQAGKAQDPRFAQFYAAPDQLNPALNVVYDGQMRFILNYRDQWSSVLNEVPFRTVAAQINYRMNISRNDYLSVGFNGLQDEAGISRLRRSKGHLNLAFMKYLGGGKKRNYYLVAGAKSGIGQHALEWNNLWFSQQYDAANEVVNTSLPSGEVETRTSRIFPDFSAGLLWYMISDKNSLYLGGAIYHLNTPDFSIFEGSIDRLKRKYTTYLGGQIRTSKYFSLLPAVALLIQGPATDINIGTNFRYSTGDQNDLALRMGGWLHITGKEKNGYSVEAFTFTTMLEMKAWTIGLSYDINTSTLTPATNSKGAFETSFIYTIQEKKRKPRVICPKF